MRTSSAKAKGRRLQQKVAERLRQHTGLGLADIASTPMGTQGIDVMLSGAARAKVPFAIETKNVEKINIWGCWKQTETNAKLTGLKPLLVFGRNHEEPLVCLTFEDFMEMLAWRQINSEE